MTTTTTTSTQTPALDQLNARFSTTRSWEHWGFDIRDEYRVGRAGRYARRGASGAKMHLVRVAVIVGGPKAAPSDIGRLWGAYSCVSGNGQFTAQPVAGLDLDAITCTRCRARAESLMR